MNLLFLANELVSTASDIVSTISDIVDTSAVAIKGYDIAFPNLGIFIETLRNNFRIGNAYRILCGNTFWKKDWCRR